MRVVPAVTGQPPTMFWQALMGMPGKGPGTLRVFAIMPNSKLFASVMSLSEKTNPQIYAYKGERLCGLIKKKSENISFSSVFWDVRK